MSKFIMKNLVLAIGISAFFNSSAVTVASSMKATSTVIPVAGTIYATAPGRATLDRGEGGGNPFASALIETLEKPLLNVADLVKYIKEATVRKSLGFQDPDSASVTGGNDWRVKPVGQLGKRVAIVATYSIYQSARVASLPGAERDRIRISNALRAAGFDVLSLRNPSKNQLSLALVDLGIRSRDAGAAFVYVTGHGFDVDGVTYLAPANYEFQKGRKEDLASAIRVDALGKGLRARYINLVFYGGCRTKL
jgi:hypothetical protein